MRNMNTTVSVLSEATNGRGAFARRWRKSELGGLFLSRMPVLRRVAVMCSLGLIPSIAMGVPVIWGGNNHAYEVVTTSQPICWSVARLDANNRGGELVTITSAAEQTFVQSLLATANPPTGSVWIGLNEQTEGVYAWLTGEPLVYTHWHPVQPDNFGGGENRGSLLWTHNAPNDGVSGLWNDMYDCSPYLEGQSYGPSRSYIVEYPCVPAVLSQPSNRAVCLSDAVTFSVSAQAAPFSATYQWRKVGMPPTTLSDQPDHIYGATTPTLILVNTTPADRGNYECVVTNACGSVTSNAAALSCAPMLNLPGAHPESRTICCDQPATFSVHPDCCGSVSSYAWQVLMDGTWTYLIDGTHTGAPWIGVVSGAYEPRLTISRLDWNGLGFRLWDNNSFRCIVSTACGSVTSNPATLSISSCVTDVDDGSGTGTPDGGVTIDDLLYFLQRFEAGC